MPDLSELYQQVILDHNRSPRNFRIIENASHDAEGNNPLCGDQVTVYVRLEDDLIQDIGFQGQGCAISKASASLMTSALRGKTRDEAEELFEKFHEMVTSAGPAKADPQTLGKLAVLQGVSEFPARVKCATLPWHTFHAALSSMGATVTTE